VLLTNILGTLLGNFNSLPNKKTAEEIISSKKYSTTATNVQIPPTEQVKNMGFG
jgi:hypothetical protein